MWPDDAHGQVLTRRKSCCSEQAATAQAAMVQTMSPAPAVLQALVKQLTSTALLTAMAKAATLVQFESLKFGLMAEPSEGPWARPADISATPSMMQTAWHSWKSTVLATPLPDS